MAVIDSELYCVSFHSIVVFQIHYNDEVTHIRVKPDLEFKPLGTFTATTAISAAISSDNNDDDNDDAAAPIAARAASAETNCSEGDSLLPTGSRKELDLDNDQFPVQLVTARGLVRLLSCLFLCYNLRFGFIVMYFIYILI